MIHLILLILLKHLRGHKALKRLIYIRYSTPPPLFSWGGGRGCRPKSWSCSRGRRKKSFFATAKKHFSCFATWIPQNTDKYGNMSANRNTRTSHNNCCAKLGHHFYTNPPFCLNNCRACRSACWSNQKRSRFTRRRPHAQAPAPRPSNYFVFSGWFWLSPSLLCKPLILSCVYAVIVVLLFCCFICLEYCFVCCCICCEYQL